MGMYDAMQYINREVLTIAHIENPRAVDNLESICEVDGLDVLFLGRGDMSHALGVPNQFDHPSVREQMERVVEKSKGSGKILGTVVRDAAQAREAIEMGYPLYRLRLRELHRRRDEAVPRGHQAVDITRILCDTPARDGRGVRLCVRTH